MKMQEYAAEHFGECGGIAQQYLFYCIREMSKNGGENDFWEYFKDKSQSRV